MGSKYIEQGMGGEGAGHARAARGAARLMSDVRRADGTAVGGVDGKHKHNTYEGGGRYVPHTRIVPRRSFACAPPWAGPSNQDRRLPSAFPPEPTE